jgi:hypothetical protein
MNLVHLAITRESAELILQALIDMPFKQVNQLVHYIDREMAFAMQEMPVNTVTVAPAQPLAKWGYKKDGTPKKVPGRPTKKVNNERT